LNTVGKATQLAFLFVSLWLFTITHAQAVVSIEPMSDINVNAGQLVEVRVVPSDTSGSVPGVYASNLPNGATFNDNLDGTRTFSWLTSSADTGATVVNFIATSAESADDTAMQSLTINVSSDSNVNMPSSGDGSADFFIEPLADQQTVVENAMLLRVIPRRTDGQVASLTYSPMFANSSFNDNGDGTRTFVFRPEVGQEGVYDVSFVASAPNDPSDTVTRTITLTETGKSDGEDVDDTNNTDQDMNNQDMNNTDQDFNLFRQSLVGIRDYGCVSIPDDNFSYQFIEAYTVDGQYIADNLVYFDTTNCDNRPLSYSSALAVENWVLGQPVVTTEGDNAWEIDYTVVQSGVDGGEPILGEVGSITRGTIMVGGGAARISLVEDDPNLPRPISITDNSTAVPYAGVTDQASKEALMGSWVSECFRGRRITRTFSETEFREFRVGFVEDDCSGDSYYNLYEIYDAEYIGEANTVFGDSVYRVNSTLRETAFDDLTIGSDVPSPPTLRSVGTRFLDIWGISRGELVVGTCLLKGQGSCANSEANIPNVLNLNLGEQFFKSSL
jgi:hypothetical protein